MTVRELAEDVGINKSAIQKQLASLQEKGFIVRTDGKRGTWHVAIVCTTGKGGTR
ncbi:MAG: winged helix-turn-helix transcriptional regulator [Bacteroidales bacterium]|nr:winged helix-turn-helix transcriptional regulator [Bacteroidales bacterium]